jgi:hypothetical protein
LKTVVIYILSLTIILPLSTCKKYDGGGLVKLTRKHLFGGNDVGDSKIWKLKLYEVNGIDSTYLISSLNIPDFYEKHITFTLTDKKQYGYSCSSYLFDHYGYLGASYKEMSVGKLPTVYNGSDSAQCKIKNNNLICSRDILFPELGQSAFLWSIIKLTKHEFIMTTTLKNSYKLKFEY